MSKPLIPLLDWFPDGWLERWQSEFVDFDFVDVRDPAVRDGRLNEAVATFAIPPVDRIADMRKLRWIQLLSAGVPPELCPIARQRGLLVTNLAGLYGTAIAEHALALMLLLSRNLHIAYCQQLERKWDKSINQTMTDLHGKTIAIIGLGNIGQEIARLCRALGMRVLGCRRTDGLVPGIDQLFPLTQLEAMLAEADYVVVSAPLTRHTEKLLGRREFAAMKRGAIYINVSRGAIAQEDALLEALQSGHLRGAGLDVYAVEPLPADHPFWTHPQVIVSPHYSGDSVNLGSLPAERFARNLRSWQQGKELEGVVDLEQGY